MLEYVTNLEMFLEKLLALLKELQIIGGVVNSTNTLPILDNFLFEVDNERLTLSCS
jgi:DNA polymerase-3 subunit beta